MTDHLPECGVSFPCGVCGNLSNRRCTCDALRACEQRTLDAAREAVERVSTLFEPLGPALAAIDALREKP